MRVFRAPGWFGVRVGRVYVSAIDSRLHRPLFSERHRVKCRVRESAGWLAGARVVAEGGSCVSRLDRIDEVRDYVWAPLSAPEQEEVLDAIPGLLTIARAAQTVVGQPTFHWESREVLALIDALADFEAGQ